MEWDPCTLLECTRPHRSGDLDTLSLIEGNIVFNILCLFLLENLPQHILGSSTPAKEWDAYLAVRIVPGDVVDSSSILTLKIEIACFAWQSLHKIR